MDLMELYKLKKKTFFKMRLPAKIHITSTLNSQDREITVTKHRSIRPEVFGKKGVLRNFAKFTGKYLCQSLVLNKVAGPGLQLY